ncbi:MAG: thioredoxin fold domain-containing protein [Bacteroidetes bacterium]|jgi:thioredoxin-related protein|nr:thioredoxin fold domain-containing protein [Bacteroidota bacterium]
MKRSILITLLIASFLGIFLYNAFEEVTPEEIDNAPDWLPIEEAMEMAQNDGRLLIIDIYEVGCQFCRAMNKDVYPAPSTRAVIDRDFHPVKINGNSEETITFMDEQMTQQAFANNLGLTAFPFTVIMDSEGNVIDSRRGYMGVQDLTQFMRNARDRAAGVTEG